MNHTNFNARKKLKFGETSGEETMHNGDGSEGEQRSLLDEEDMEVAEPSRTYRERRRDSGSNDSWSSLKRIKQNAMQNFDDLERKKKASDHSNQEDGEKPSTSTQLQDPISIIIGSDTEDEDELPAFDGSQLVKISSSSDEDSPVASPNALPENVPSNSSKRHSTPDNNTDSSGSKTPEIIRTISLSGFPKRNKERKRKRNNPELETALLTMHSDEKNAFSQLYDEVGGSLSMSQDITPYIDCDDQHIGTHERSNGSNPRIATPESSELKKTPSTKCPSPISANVHDASTYSQSERSIHITNRAKNTDNIRGVLNHPADVANSSNNIAFTSSTFLTSAHAEASAEGRDSGRAQPKETSNGTDKLEPTSAAYHTPVKPLDDQPLSSSNVNKSSDIDQNMKSSHITNMPSEQHNKGTKDKDIVLANLEKKMKKHAAQQPAFSRHAPSTSKILGSSTTHILSDMEHASSPSVSKTSNEQPVNFQFTSRLLKGPQKYSPGVSNPSGEQTTRNLITKEALAQALSSVSVDPATKVLKSPCQSEAHLSAATTGIDVLTGQHSSSPLDKKKCTIMAASSPVANKGFAAKESLMKESATSREESPTTSPGVRGGKASEVHNETPNQQLIKTFANQMKEGAFQKQFNGISTVVKSQILMTPRNTLQSKEGQTGDDAASPSAEHRLEKEERTPADENAEPISGQTEDEAASHSDLEDEHMLVEEEEEDEDKDEEDEEERTPADKDSVPLSGDVNAERSLEPVIASHTRKSLNSLTGSLSSGQSEDDAASQGDLEDETMLVEEEERTTADEDSVPLSDAQNAPVLASNSSQTEISSGFPGNVENLLNFTSDQKKQLMDSYKETEKLMLRTGDMKEGSTQAFWQLCQQNNCREFLLTLTTCYVKSVIHKIIHEVPEDKDYDRAFAILQASGCFADFINGSEGKNGYTDDRENMSSRTSNNKPDNESISDSVDCCTEKRDQRKSTIDEDHDGKEPESPKTSSTGNQVRQCERNEGHNKEETESSKTNSLSMIGKVKGKQPSSECNRKEESSRDEAHDEIQGKMSGSSLKSNRKEKTSRVEDHDGTQCESSGSSSETNRNTESSKDEDHTGMQCESSGSPSKTNRNTESSRDEDHNGMLCESSGSSSETNVNKENSRDEDHNGIQRELSGSSSESSRKERSHNMENVSKLETRSPEASPFSASANNRGDMISPENTCGGQMMEALPLTLGTQQPFLLCHVPQQPEDMDASFVTYLLQLLRKVPKLQKPATHESILNVVYSVLNQQSMSTSSPDCVPQHTNPSSS